MLYEVITIGRAGDAFGLYPFVNGFGEGGILDQSAGFAGIIIQPLAFVITSYSIHYTKLYDPNPALPGTCFGNLRAAAWRV